MEDDAKRCAAGVAVAATLGFLVDLGLMAAASYCALLIQGFELPVPQDGAYDWVRCPQPSHTASFAGYC